MNSHVYADSESVKDSNANDGRRFETSARPPSNLRQAGTEQPALRDLPITSAAAPRRRQSVIFGPLSKPRPTEQTSDCYGPGMDNTRDGPAQPKLRPVVFPHVTGSSPAMTMQQRNTYDRGLLDPSRRLPNAGSTLKTHSDAIGSENTKDSTRLPSTHAQRGPTGPFTYPLIPTGAPPGAIANAGPRSQDDNPGARATEQAKKRRRSEADTAHKDTTPSSRFTPAATGKSNETGPPPRPNSRKFGSSEYTSNTRRSPTAPSKPIEHTTQLKSNDKPTNTGATLSKDAGNNNDRESDMEVSPLFKTNSSPKPKCNWTAFEHKGPWCRISFYEADKDLCNSKHKPHIHRDGDRDLSGRVAIVTANNGEKCALVIDDDGNRAGWLCPTDLDLMCLRGLDASLHKIRVSFQWTDVTPHGRCKLWEGVASWRAFGCFRTQDNSKPSVTQPDAELMIKNEY
ncbi:hypothetical protein BJ508DRAFT_308166 [Ascobolus immersus RN42]|uniref:Uncharacterized protein n=1 Tax=Ascobolus immersus RN42 TaxID=1160509 RepID=A0A3N4I2M7_ASCIM|nr:hypothetical protein BJ508DRAFT_308166 [Ascobolus immersus RN42]